MQHNHCFAVTNCTIKGIKNNEEYFSLESQCYLTETLHKLRRLYLKTIGHNRSMQVSRNAFFSTSSRSSTWKKIFGYCLEILTVSMLNDLLTFFTTTAYTALFFFLHRFASVSTKQTVFTIIFSRLLIFSHFSLTSLPIKLFWIPGRILHWKSITQYFRTPVKKSRLSNANQ